MKIIKIAVSLSIFFGCNTDAFALNDEAMCLDYILIVAPYIESANYDIQCLENHMKDKKAEICSSFSFKSAPSENLIEYVKLIEEENALEQELTNAKNQAQKARASQKLELLSQKFLLSDADDIVAAQLDDINYNNGAFCN